MLLRLRPSSTAAATSPALPHIVKPGVTVQVLLVNRDQVGKIDEADIAKVCRNDTFDLFTPLWNVTLGGSPDKEALTTNLSIRIPTQARYYIVQLNCYKVKYSITLHYNARNSNGSYLDLEYEPLVFVYNVMGGLYALTFLLSLLNIIQYRFFNIKAQMTLLPIPLSNMVLDFVNNEYWVVASRTGRYPLPLAWLSYALDGVRFGILFFCVLVVGSGYGVIEDRVSRSDLKLYATVSIFVVFAYLLFSYFQNFVIFLLIIGYAVFLRYMFNSMTYYGHLLLDQLHILAQNGVRASNTPAFAKFSIYRNFQITVISYICISLILQLWANMFLASTPWAQEVLSDLFGVACVGTLLYLFRMRPFDAYWHAGEPAHDAEDINMPLLGHRDWRPGMPVPRIDGASRFWMRSASGPTVVVEYPRRYVEEDIRYTPLAIGHTVKDV